MKWTIFFLNHIRCHHNPTDCLALELWRVFYSDKLGPSICVVHHEFAFPKTSNYPEIVQNLDRLLCLMSNPDATEDDDDEEDEEDADERGGIRRAMSRPPTTMINATTTSFMLELKQCEVGFFLEDRLCACLARFSELRVLAVPGLASDKLLNVIALYCTNLEVLNVKGAREQVRERK